jgi:hypothetical protein
MLINSLSISKSAAMIAAPSQTSRHLAAVSGSHFNIKVITPKEMTDPTMYNASSGDAGKAFPLGEKGRAKQQQDQQQESESRESCQ